MSDVSRQCLKPAFLFCAVLAGWLAVQLAVSIARGEELISGAGKGRLIASARKSCISTASKKITSPNRGLKKKLIVELCECYASEVADHLTTKEVLDFDGEISPTVHA
jgi:hypothetical protein